MSEVNEITDPAPALVPAGFTLANPVKFGSGLIWKKQMWYSFILSSIKYGILSKYDYNGVPKSQLG